MQFQTTTFEQQKQVAGGKTFNVLTAEQKTTAFCDYDKCKAAETGTKIELENSGWFLSNELTLCGEHSY